MSLLYKAIADGNGQSPSPRVDSAKRDWKAAKAFLESRWPEEWGQGRKRKPERQLPQPTPVVINVTLATGQTLADAIPSSLLQMVMVQGRALEAEKANSLPAPTT